MPDHYEDPHAEDKIKDDDDIASALSAYATDLYSRVVECARRRSDVERRWYLDTLQYQGHYDDVTQARLDSRDGASKLFVNQTRPKTNVMRDRLMEILFPKDEANWDIQTTPSPHIDKRAAETHDREQEPELARIDDAARKFKTEMNRRVDSMREEMADQLEECDYTEIGTRVVDQGCKLGTGVCKGPFSGAKPKKRWHRAPEEDGGWTMQDEEDNRPAFEWVDLWDFYPDMDAMEIKDCEYIFQLHRMSKKQIMKMADSGEFDKKEAISLLENEPTWSPISENFDEYLRYIRLLDQSPDDGLNRRYEVFEYHGQVPYDTLKEIADSHDKGQLIDSAMNPENPLKTVEAVIWFSHDRILKFGLKPTQGDDPVYSLYRLEKSDASIFGVGIPAMVRDPQAALNAAWRMTIENGGLAGVPMYVVNRDMIEPDGGEWNFSPGSVFWKTGSDKEGKGVEAIQLQGTTKELMEIIQTAMRFMDDESRLPLVAQGDPGTAARQTAHGMSLLVNAVNIVFKAAAMRFDKEFTIPNIKRLYNWNMEHSEKTEIKGDMNVRALGSSVLLVRELQAQNLLMILNLAATNPLLADMIRIPSLARKMFQALQIERDDIVLSDEELEQLAQQKKENQEVDPDIQAKLQIEQIKAETAMQVAQFQMQQKVLELAAQGEMKMSEIMANLEKVKIETASKERLTAAEFAIKERHGTGI